MSAFVGVDQALTKIGLCVIADGQIAKLHLIKTPTKLKGPERLTFLRDSLLAELKPWKKKISKAAIEAQSLGSLGDIDQLGQINGVVQVLLSDLGAPPLKVPPAVLKKFVSGNGQADKGRMRRATHKHWGIDISQDDLCDAHGLARLAEEVCLEQATLRYQIEAAYTMTQKRKRKSRVKKLFKKTL